MKKELDRRNKFFDEQYWYAKNFLKNYLPFDNYKNLRILEVGSGEGGGLKYFHELRAECYGVEITKDRITFARTMISEDVEFLLGDICDPVFVDRLPRMDLIILRDVIEHIPQKKPALQNIIKILKKNGIAFISFPPKYSPYAGHQQNIKAKYGRLPFIHLFPDFVYSTVLKLVRAEELRTERLLMLKKNLVSLREMEKMFSGAGFKIFNKDLYLIRPCYEKRFGLKSRKIFLNEWPLLREFFTLGAIYLLKKNVNSHEFVS